MPGHGVQSFGQRIREPQEQGPVVLPPIVLPAVRVPVVLVVDATSLRDVAAQISQMVAQAVQDGLGQALAGEPGTGPDAAQPDGPVVASGQLADLAR